MIAILKQLYSISCYYFAWESDAIYDAMNNYVRPYADNLLATFDKIISYPTYIESWKMLFKSDYNFICGSSLQNASTNWSEKNQAELYFLCENNLNNVLELLIKRVEHSLNKCDIDFVIVTCDRSVDVTMKIGEKEYSTKYIDDVPKGALVIHELLFGGEKVINISCILAMLSLDLVPLLGEEYCDWIEWTGARYKRIENLYAILELGNIATAVEDIIVEH